MVRIKRLWTFVDLQHAHYSVDRYIHFCIIIKFSTTVLHLFFNMIFKVIILLEHHFEFLYVENMHLYQWQSEMNNKFGSTNFGDNYGNSRWHRYSAILINLLWTKVCKCIFKTFKIFDKLPQLAQIYNQIKRSINTAFIEITPSKLVFFFVFAIQSWLVLSNPSCIHSSSL